jgi:hypothetical protein
MPKKARLVAPARLNQRTKATYLLLDMPMSTGAGAGAGCLEAQEAKARAAVASTTARRVDFIVLMMI